MRMILPSSVSNSLISVIICNKYYYHREARIEEYNDADDDEKQSTLDITVIIIALYRASKEGRRRRIMNYEIYEGNNLEEWFQHFR